VFTRYLANRLHPESCVLAIERNQGFYQELCRWRRVAPPQCRLILEHADCREVRKLRSRYRLPAFDYVLSGIPFSMLSERDREQIVLATFESLASEGSFLVYQTTPRMSTRLSKVFDRVERDWSWFNFPPLAILRARKHSHAVKGKAKRRAVLVAS
jgi:phospholipid N-methyltransferase